jgi:hypothetical protein
MSLSKTPNPFPFSVFSVSPCFVLPSFLHGQKRPLNSSSRSAIDTPVQVLSGQRWQTEKREKEPRKAKGLISQPPSALKLFPAFLGDGLFRPQWDLCFFVLCMADKMTHPRPLNVCG